MTMPDEDMLILPGVKGGVRALARIALIGLILSAVLSVVEILLLSSGFIRFGISCGVAGSLILALDTVMLSLLAAWCHRVLLFQRGYFLTACLAGSAFILSLAWSTSLIYSLLTGKLLLLNQGLIPMLICPVLLLIHLFNLPNMAAASLWLKIRLGIFPILLLFVYICDQPGLIMLAGIGKLLLWVLLAGPLRQLADLAPRVISMPPTKESDTEEQS